MLQFKSPLLYQSATESSIVVFVTRLGVAMILFLFQSRQRNRNMVFLITLMSVTAVVVNSHVRLLMRETGMLIKLSLRLCQLMELLTKQRGHSRPC